MRLLLATHNEHKRREFERLLAAGANGPHEVLMLPNTLVLPPETGDTFQANALGKARAAAALTGERTIADDSGIEATALGGAPGVRSARYAGAQATDLENLSKLISAAPAGSELRYVCVIAFVDPSSGREQCFHGTCAGRLEPRTRGQRGFGYDPAFLPNEGPPDMTMAQLSDEEKDAISHRGRAARALLQWLREDYQA